MATFISSKANLRPLLVPPGRRRDGSSHPTFSRDARGRDAWPKASAHTAAQWVIAPYLVWLAANASAQQLPVPEGAFPRLDSGQWVDLGKLDAVSSFTIDDRGRVFVSASGRGGGAGVFSVADHPARMQEDLAIETVAQRRALLQTWLDRGELAADLEAAGLAVGDGAAVLRQKSETITLFEDADGDYRAELRSLFAGGFNDEMDGPAAGLVAGNSDLWFLCPPHLWLLRDFEKDNRANMRTALVAGLGVRVGRPEHGPGPITVGPEGRLYFAVGDRGYNVHSNEERNFYGPTSGAVFRCWPDGQDLEIYARGFRAPTALAFDEAGRLLVADGALYLIPEGAEIGWEASLADRPGDLARWSAEKRLWCVPPLGGLDKPLIDLVLCPRTALVPPWSGRLLAADRDGIIGLALEFEGGRPRVSPIGPLKAIRNVRQIWLAPEGSLFFLVREKTSASIGFLRSAPNALQRETAAYLKSGFRHRRINELTPLLAHHDDRVRGHTQSALVEKGWREAVPALVTTLHSGAHRTARRHAIWAMRGLARENPLLLTPLLGLLNDPDEHIRRLAAEVLADGRCLEAGPAIVPLLNDPSGEVRAAAAAGLGRLAAPRARDLLMEAAARGGDDELVRHGIVMGLAALGDPRASLETARHQSAPAARLAGLLALRRLESPLCAEFLNDDDPALRLEAARAIYDLELGAALPALAEMLGKAGPARPDHSAELLRLAIAANLRLGRASDAERVAAFAASPHGSVPDDLRVLALDGLEHWDAPPAREPIWGRHAPVSPREAARARKPLLAHLPRILQNSSGPAAAIAQRLRASVAHGPGTAQETIALIGDDSQPEGLRRFFLRELESQGAAETLENACRVALASASAALRIEARALLIRRKPAQALDLLTAALASAQASERQNAVSQLAALSSRGADQILLRLLERATLGDADLEVVPELLEATQLRERNDTGSSRDFREAVEKLRTSWRAATADPLRPWRAAEKGGDAEAGRALFRSSLCRCTECHAINGRGSGTAPDLGGVADRFSAGGLLESIVQPSARIASGYGFVTALRRDGSTASGILKAANAEAFTLRSSAGSVVVPRAELKEMTSAESECRPVGTLLTLRETRDLVAYLKTLK